MRLTNYKLGENVRFGEILSSFSYKRDDFSIDVNREKSRYFTPHFFERGEYYLTNSGQCSISLVLFYLSRKNTFLNFSSLSDVYVGTKDAFELFNLDLKSGLTEHLWICSSAVSVDFVIKALENTDPLDLCIIDTTCWALDEIQFIQILEKVESSQTLLVRSHSKLDMNGVEYGSLGSICSSVCLGDDFKTSYRILSAAPSLCDIPPQLFTQDFFTSNNERCERIAKNTNFIKNNLAIDGIELCFPEHKKYFSIKLMKNMDISKLFLLLQNMKVNFKSIRSFGFNFWNVETFTDKIKDEEILRICPSSQYCEQTCKKIIWCLNKFFTKGRCVRNS